MKTFLKYLSFTLVFVSFFILVSCEDDEEIEVACSQCSDSAMWATGAGGSCYSTQSECEDDNGTSCQSCN